MAWQVGKVEYVGVALATLSKWIDAAPANLARDAEANLCLRVAKVSEECGEAVQALIGVTGQNPRKGVTHDLDDVVAELLDVAVTALAAVEHITGNRGDSTAALTNHVRGLMARAGLDGSGA